MNNRYYSLDVFRGATVALMILVNNPGSWGHIYAPLEHAPWHGCTPTDLVFPFFLFAVGNAMAFVMPRLKAAGDATFWKKVVKRFILIFLIGLFLNWWPFFRYDETGALVFKGWEWTNSNGVTSGVRVMGVLQRISLCYLFASIIVYYCKPKAAFILSTIILLLYWLLCYLLGDRTDPYSLAGFAGTGLDVKLFGEAHVYKGEGVPFDPEGLFSTIPAIVQVVFGYLTGRYIREKGKNFEMLSTLFVAGAALIFIGFAWDMAFPINKKIWSSSYVVYTAGLALMVLGVMIYLLEFKQAAGTWSRFFDVFGKNALFVFSLSAFLPKGLSLIKIHYLNAKGEDATTSPWSWLYQRVLIKIPGIPENGSLAYALCVIFFMWAICWWMDKKRIYVKV